MKYILVFIGIINVYYSSACFSSWKNEPPELKGIVNRYQLDRNVIVHNYQSPADIISLSSYIIELPKRLIIIDTQLFLPYAKEILLYAYYLRKPISRVYITHEHADHYFGSEIFKGKAPIYALEETIQRIKDKAQADINRIKPMFGDLVPSTITLPDKVQPLGDEYIDGVLFHFRKVENTENPYTLHIYLPDYKTIFVGDFIFNKEHLFLQDLNIDDWLKYLRDFNDNYYFKRIFVGHNGVGDHSIIRENIYYLEYAKKLLNESNDFDYFKAKILKKYPFYGSVNIIDFLRPVFPKKITISNSISLTGNSKCYPDGIGIYNGKLYASCYETGEIQIIDLMINKPIGQMIPFSDPALTTPMALQIDINADLLFSCRNPPINSSNNLVSEIQVFNLTDSRYVNSIKLPVGRRCKSLSLDKIGDIYIADHGLNPCILKLNRKFGSINVWKKSDLWKPVMNFGLGGALLVDSSIYAFGAGSYLYKISINPDGSAGDMLKVIIKRSNGSEFLFDGIYGSAYAGNNVIIFTLNDVSLLGAQGIVYKVELDKTGINGVISIIAQNLKEPASVSIYNNYAFVSISQLGTHLGYDKISPTIPFTINAYSLNN